MPRSHNLVLHRPGKPDPLRVSGFKTAFFAVAKKPGKKIQMTERHLNWILLRKIKKADESPSLGV